MADLLKINEYYRVFTPNEYTHGVKIKILSKHSYESIKDNAKIKNSIHELAQIENVRGGLTERTLIEYFKDKEIYIGSEIKSSTSNDIELYPNSEIYLWDEIISDTTYKLKFQNDFLLSINIPINSNKSIEKIIQDIKNLDGDIKINITPKITSLDEISQTQILSNYKRILSDHIDFLKTLDPKSLELFNSIITNLKDIDEKLTTANVSLGQLIS